MALFDTLIVGFPLGLEIIIESYGWRNTYKIVSVFIGVCIVIILFFI